MFNQNKNEANSKAKEEKGLQDENKLNKNCQKNPSMKLLGALKTVWKRVMIRNLPAIWTDNLTTEELEWLLFFVVSDRGFAVNNVCVTRSRETGVFCGVVEFMHECDVQRFVDGLDKQGQFFVGEWGVYLSAFRMLENNNKKHKEMDTKNPQPKIEAKKDQMTENAPKISSNVDENAKENAIPAANNEPKKQPNDSIVLKKSGKFVEEKLESVFNEGKENLPFETTKVYSREKLLDIRTFSSNRLSSSAEHNILAFFKELSLNKDGGGGQGKKTQRKTKIEFSQTMHQNNENPISNDPRNSSAAARKSKETSNSSPNGGAKSKNLVEKD